MVSTEVFIGRFKSEIAWRNEPTTIPLREGVFDDPLQFLREDVRNDLETIHYSRERLAHYHVVFWNPDAPQSVIQPRNIAFDGDNTLMLYADFGTPTARTQDKASGLAVSSFNVSSYIDAQASAVSTTGNVYKRVLDIVQFQTASFPDTTVRYKNDRKEMGKYLGFIRYQDLLLHLTEQIALRASQEGICGLGYVSIQKSMKYDKNRASKLARQLSGYAYDPEQIAADYKKIVEKRAAWAAMHGYTETLRADYHESWAKPVTAIEPDHTLQAYFSSIGMDARTLRL